MFPVLLEAGLLGDVKTVTDGTASFPIHLGSAGVLGSAQQAPQNSSSVLWMIAPWMCDGSSLWFRSHFPSHIAIVQRGKLRFRKVRAPAGGLAARISRDKTQV